MIKLLDDAIGGGGPDEAAGEQKGETADGFMGLRGNSVGKLQRSHQERRSGLSASQGAGTGGERIVHDLLEAIARSRF